MDAWIQHTNGVDDTRVVFHNILNAVKTCFQAAVAAAFSMKSYPTPLMPFAHYDVPACLPLLHYVFQSENILSPNQSRKQALLSFFSNSYLFLCFIRPALSSPLVPCFEFQQPTQLELILSLSLALFYSSNIVCLSASSLFHFHLTSSSTMQ